MFNWIKGFLLGFLAGAAALAAFGLTHHVVRTTEGFRAVRKDPWTFEKIYVDARTWGPVDYLQNRDVVQALARAGYQQSKEQAEQSLKNGRDALQRTLDDAKRDLENAFKKP